MKDKEEFRQWIEKAEADHDAASLLIRHTRKRRADSSCFHSQQCVEKYLKAFLFQNGIPFRKTHDLMELLDLARKIDPLVSVLQNDLALLNAYSIAVRYPGDEATLAEARAAVKTMKKLRLFLRKKLELRR